MTQTGTINIDFKAPGFKEATHTRLTDFFSAPLPMLYDIKFTKPFADVPTVLLSVAGIDSGTYVEHRIKFFATPIDITSTSFKIELMVDRANSIAAVNIGWLATDT